MTYYDDYSLMSNDSLQFDDTQGYAASEKLNAVQGLPTGSMTRILNPDTGESNWLETATYYDYRYRPIQAISTNLEGGVDKETMFYDFSNNVTGTVSRHKRNAAAVEQKITKEVSFDHANRHLVTTHQLGDVAADKVTLVENKYNELGQLVDKKLHKGYTDNSFMQSVDYSYNARGWLVSINNSELSGADEARHGDFFGMKLHYNSGFDVLQFNGNIAGMKWRNVLDEHEQSYGFLYDDLHRIKMADYAAKNMTGWMHDAAGYQVRLLNFDDNGNIKALERRGLMSQDPLTGLKTFGVIDNLGYTYFANQLTKVADAGDATKGFKNNTPDVENEYTYDANGNLDRDLNKEIDTIRYNFLNLPEEIKWSNGNRIVNTYTASGTKLKQKVVKDTLVKERFYSGQFLYEDSVLHTIFTDEGRIVNYAATEHSLPAEPWRSDYQYHLKDHLGNVRSTFSSIRGTDSLTYEATMEPGHPDTALFNNLETAHHDVPHNHTPGGTYAAYLYGAGAIVGPAIAIPVSKGDTVRMEVWAQYKKRKSETTALADLAEAVALAFGGVPPAGGEGPDALYTLLNGAAGLVGLVGTSDQDDPPNATLNYLFFDENFQFPANPVLGVDFGFEEVSAAAQEFGWEQLTLEKTVGKKGYLYIYVANETQGDKVWFDDMTITQFEHPVVQSDDYYPFGLAFNSYSSGVENDFLYKGGAERQDELDLNVDFTRYRMGDPAMGRWWQVDPLSDAMVEWIPYDYSFNNPIRYNDAEGDCPTCEPALSKRVFSLKSPHK